MVRHLNFWIACCHLLLFMSLHELVSLNVLSWHELSISNHIHFPRASKLPMFNETWNPHHPSSLVAVPRGFRTTKTGRVSGGGDNSTRRMRPKGSSYAGSSYQTQGKICRKLPGKITRFSCSFSVIRCSINFFNTNLGTQMHQNFCSNFSIAGAWLTATCFKVAQAMHPCIARWMPRKEWTINKVEHCWSLLESHADQSPSLGQQQPSPARSAKLHRPELGASRPEMCKWRDIYTWEVAASVGFEHESCMNVSELTLPQEREKNDQTYKLSIVLIHHDLYYAHTILYLTQMWQWIWVTGVE